MDILSNELQFFYGTDMSEKKGHLVNSSPDISGVSSIEVLQSEFDQALENRIKQSMDPAGHVETCSDFASYFEHTQDA